MNNQWNNIGRNEMATREANRRNEVEVPRELEHREQVRAALKGKRRSRARTMGLLLVAVLILIALAVVVAVATTR